MGEQRNPFKRCRPVRIRTPDQFVLAVRKFDEFGVTKLANEFGVIT
jgi:hypothetical protein